MKKKCANCKHWDPKPALVQSRKKVKAASREGHCMWLSSKECPMVGASTSYIVTNCKFLCCEWQRFVEEE